MECQTRVILLGHKHFFSSFSFPTRSTFTVSEQYNNLSTMPGANNKEMDASSKVHVLNHLNKNVICP